MIVTASWPDTGIIPPTDTRTQYGFEDGDNPLIEDGFPRMTSEGLDILKEGLAGDFSRWRWAIGNHPLQMPRDHLRNIIIECEKEEPHYMVRIWYGLHYPVTTKNLVLSPRWPFDQLDTNRIEEYCHDPLTYVTLRQSTDFWSNLPVLLDNNGRCATQGNAPKEDEEELEDCTICTQVPETVPVHEESRLDYWMGGDL